MHVLALEAMRNLDQHWNESVEEALAPPSGVCKMCNKFRETSGRVGGWRGGP